MRHHRLTQHQVLQTHSEVSGCEPILFTGTYEACVDYIASLPTWSYEQLTAGNYDLDILNQDTGRLVSYVIK